MKLVAKTLYGLEGVLAEELKDIGALNIQIANRAVLFNGNKELLYGVNYNSRCALSVLVSVADFRIRSKEDLYKGASKTDWSSIMDNESTFSIVPVVNSKLFDHSGYPALVVKDAIADYFRKKTGIRPSVDSTSPSILINLHISNDKVNLSLDSSVVPLFKRGYRVEQGIAPLNEVLAAGILKLSGWDVSSSLKDPMCGSGTIPVEAGLIACRIPPGKFRNFFGFSKWKDYDEELFDKVKKSSDDKIIELPVRITASDISEQAVKQATINIAKAGLSDKITVVVSDFKDVKSVDNNGFLVFNPPYGERIKPDETGTLYSMIGSTLKHNFAGYKAWIITPGKEFLRNIGLKPKAKYILFNGAIECTLAAYEMYEGSKKRTSL